MGQPGQSLKLAITHWQCHQRCFSIAPRNAYTMLICRSRIGEDSRQDQRIALDERQHIRRTRILPIQGHGRKLRYHIGHVDQEQAVRTGQSSCFC